MEEKQMKDETKELPLEEKVKVGFKEDFNQADCKKGRYGKDYYACKESEKGPICIHAISLVYGKYVCPKEGKK
jgi:hypothetical protein